ncbi:hypothetical protein PI125_g17250 [Phytophthora idaei]|nr:hypothetical protein PI125_g17250 [Phytophthora idaei]
MPSFSTSLLHERGEMSTSTLEAHQHQYTGLHQRFMGAHCIAFGRLKQNLIGACFCTVIQSLTVFVWCSNKNLVITHDNGTSSSASRIFVHFLFRTAELFFTTTGDVPTSRLYATFAHSDSVLSLGGYQTQESTISRSTIHELDVVGYPVHCGNGPSVLHGFVGGVYNNSLIVFEKRTPTSMVSCYKKLQLQHESIPAAPDSTVISERSSHCYLRSLVGNSTLSDITFIVEGIKIFGHVNLCARYTSFQDIFVVSFTFVITSGLVAINVGHPFTSVADTSNDHISTRLGWILRRPLFARDA